MRNFQFWVLLFGSGFVSALMIEQIFLSRDVYRQQRQLIDNQEIATSGAAYQNTWRQLAVHIYSVSHQDPELTAVLRNNKVVIGTTPPPAATTPTLAPSSKSPSSAPHPAGQ